MLYTKPKNFETQEKLPFEFKISKAHTHKKLAPIFASLRKGYKSIPVSETHAP